MFEQVSPKGGEGAFNRIWARIKLCEVYVGAYSVGALIQIITVSEIRFFLKIVVHILFEVKGVQTKDLEPMLLQKFSSSFRGNSLPEIALALPIKQRAILSCF